jgi:valyl-tRNA synthetase
MNLDGYQVDEITQGALPEDFSLPDRWIRGKLNQAIREVHRSLEEYKFNEASHTLYHFIWHEFCDWYLELTKLDLYHGGDTKRRNLAQKTLIEVLDAVLRLLHPFMPFITEEIWQKLPGRRENESIMVGELPKPHEKYDDEAVAKEMGFIIEITNALRNIRGEMNLPPGEHISVLFRTKAEEVEVMLRENQSFIKFLAQVKEFQFGRDLAKPLYSAFVTIRDVEIFVPMERSRMEEEAKRLKKEILKIEKESAFVVKKLSNEQFVSKAPPEVVQEVKEKALEFRTQREKLEESLHKIREMLTP